MHFSVLGAADLGSADANGIQQQPGVVAAARPLAAVQLVPVRLITQQLADEKYTEASNILAAFYLESSRCYSSTDRAIIDLGLPRLPPAGQGQGSGMLPGD